jgi:hypothetical protein
MCTSIDFGISLWYTHFAVALFNRMVHERISMRARATVRRRELERWWPLAELPHSSHRCNTPTDSSRHL